MKTDCTVQLPIHGESRSKHPPVHVFHILSVDELKSLRPGMEIFAMGRNMSEAYRIRVNGKPKTWKTRPNDVEVPYKYGMYEHGYLSGDKQRALMPETALNTIV